MWFPNRFNRAVIALAIILAVGLYGCEGLKPDPPKEEKRDSIFGEGGLFFGTGRAKNSDQENGIGVNSFLWRATLDTIAFMPVNSVDPFGGVIITDWYSPPETPDERFKMNVYILGRALRADGVRVAVFKERLRDGAWTTAPVGPGVATDIENAILLKARQLRNASVEQ
jgi:hypothetical protein